VRLRELPRVAQTTLQGQAEIPQYFPWETATVTPKGMP
jgi:hypothetical protein